MEAGLVAKNVLQSIVKSLPCWRIPEASQLFLRRLLMIFVKRNFETRAAMSECQNHPIVHADFPLESVNLDAVLQMQCSNDDNNGGVCGTDPNKDMC